jgi:hypothetical protein
MAAPYKLEARALVRPDAGPSDRALQRGRFRALTH